MLYTRFGCDAKNKLSLLRLTQDLGFPEGASFFTSAVSVVDEFVGEFEYVSNDADIFTFKTNHSAPKGKVVRVSEKFLQAKLHASARGLHTSCHASEMDGFSGYATSGIDIRWMELLIFVCNP